MRIRPPHVDDGFYHVMLRGNARQAIFRDERDREILEDCLRDALEYYSVEVHAYCWMTNHLHLLMRISAEPVQHPVRHFASSYARRFNRKYERVGHIFQGRHLRRHVADDVYLKQVVRYIHRNPVEGGIVAHPVDYRWSSYRAYLGHQQSSFALTSFVLAQFGGNSELARQSLAAFTESSSIAPSPWSTWAELVEQAEERFGVSEAEIIGEVRTRHLADARCWIAKHALEAELGSVSDIALRLGRTPSGLSRMLRQRRDSK